MVDWLAQNWTTIATILSIILALVSIGLTIALIKKRKLLFHEYDVRTTVFQSEEAGSRLTALYDGEEIQDDVTGIQIAIWNEGGKPIRKENMLEEPRIISDDEVQILEARLVDRSRDVTGFETFNPESSNDVFITWDILEKDDGGVIQLLYSGSPDAEFDIIGTIEEQDQIFNSQSRVPIFGDFTYTEYFMRSIGVIGLLFYSLFIILPIISAFSKYDLSHFSDDSFVIAFVLSSLVILYGLKGKEFLTPDPPFEI